MEQEFVELSYGEVGAGFLHELCTQFEQVLT
jgi:hypothetical protein